MGPAPVMTTWGGVMGQKDAGDHYGEPFSHREGTRDYEKTLCASFEIKAFASSFNPNLYRHKLYRV